MAYSGNTFLWSALLFAGAAGLALILWNWLQDKRRHWQRTVCAILCTGAVLAGVWYFWPFELAARPADQGGLRVVAEYPAEPGKSLALEGEEAEALLRLIDPIRVRRYRLWDYPPRDGREYIFLRMWYEERDITVCRIELSLRLDDTLGPSTMRYYTFAGSRVNYVVCDPKPAAAYLKPLLGL